MPIIIIWIAVMCSIFVFPALLLKIYEFCREILYDYKYKKMKEESYERERMESVPDQEVGREIRNKGEVKSRYYENGNSWDTGRSNKERGINESRYDETDSDDRLKF